MKEETDNQKIEFYEIENKKYTVVTKCIENNKNNELLYSILCKFAISKLN